MFKKSIIVGLLLLIPSLSWGGFAENVNTGTTAATSTTLVEHVELNSTHGVTTSDWLIIYSAGVAVDSDSGALVRSSFMKNDTSLTDNVSQVEPDVASSSIRLPNQWWYMNEGGSSTDTFQIKVSSNGSTDVTMGNGGIVGIDLGNLTKNTDWVIGDAENGAAKIDAATTTWEDASTITIPANNSGSKWLILARINMRAASTGNDLFIRLEIDDSSTWGGSNEWDVEDSIEVAPMMLSYLYTVPDNDTHTIDVQGYITTGSVDYENSNIIAVNLDELSNVVDFDQSETNETNAGDAYADFTGASKSVNFSSTGDYLALTYMAVNQTTTNTAGTKAKLLINNTDSIMERIYQGSSGAEGDTKPHIMFDVFTVASTGSQDVDSQFAHNTSGATTATVTEGSMIVFREEGGEPPGVTGSTQPTYIIGTIIGSIQ